MQESGVTSWFPASVNPSKPGVYQRIDEYAKIYYSKYAHFSWHRLAFTVDEANSSWEISHFQKLPWRGLCKKSK
jgi:hypothetical protein